MTYTKAEAAAASRFVRIGSVAVVALLITIVGAIVSSSVLVGVGFWVFVIAAVIALWNLWRLNRRQG